MLDPGGRSGRQSGATPLSLRGALRTYLPVHPLPDGFNQALRMANVRVHGLSILLRIPGFNPPQDFAMMPHSILYRT